jgi:hypothetical protein
MVLKLSMGSPLETLEADALMYLKQMKALKRAQAATMTQSLRQVFLNLLGRDNREEPTNFSGASVSPEDLEKFLADPYYGPFTTACHGILLTFFGEYVRYADMVVKIGHDYLQKGAIAAPLNMLDTLMKGVSCLAAAQETGKKKYAKLGQIIRSKIKKWLAMGNPNVKHYESFLDAEWKAFKGKTFDAVKHYEATILMAARAGYQHDAALATERLGAFHLRVTGNREDAAYQIGRSIQYWGEWGAVAKVRHLEEKYADLLEPKKPTEIVAVNST